MGELAEQPLIEGEDLFAMGDIGPCELIDARIVPTRPTGGVHGRVDGNLAYLSARRVLLSANKSSSLESFARGSQ